MELVKGITQDAKQVHTLIMTDGTEFTITMGYRDLQYGWFIDELEYGDFVRRGLRINNNPNMLRQFSNLIPFGLACFSNDNREPYHQEDFETGASKLYVLTTSEVEDYEEYLKE